MQRICPDSSLEAAIVKQRLKYFGHIMRKDSSLEKSLMLASVVDSQVKESHVNGGWRALPSLQDLGYRALANL